MMLNNIKIAILGTTGAGKTSYLLGMYAVMQTGIKGFTLSAKDMDMDLDLTEKWEKLINVQGEDRWPPPNAAAMDSYSFDFSYGFRPIMGFDWLDYRGLALSDRSTEQDVQELTTYLTDSACLFLSVSGEHLGEQITPATVRDIKSDRMNQFLQQIISKYKQPNSDNPFPVAIVITKYDLCHHRERQAVVEDIKRLFQGLFAPNSGWLVMICPVSLGKELSNDPEHGNIVPVNVHLPIAFAIYSQLRIYALKLKNARHQLYEEIEKLKMSTSLLRPLRRRQMKDKTNNLEDLDAKITTVEENMNLLAEELQQVSLYLSGKEVKADV
jgi:GTPase SAR1 family protein